MTKLLASSFCPHCHPSLKVPLEQHEPLAGVAPALSGWTERLERLGLRPPVGEPSRVGQYVADRDTANDGLLQVIHEFECEMRNNLLDERRRVHHRRVALDTREAPTSHDRDRLEHASGTYARARAIRDAMSSRSSERAGRARSVSSRGHRLGRHDGRQHGR